MFRLHVLLVALVLLFALPRASAQDSATPTPLTTTYQVRSGDTLGSIAARFGTSVGAIMRLNHLANPELVVLGQTLRIPVTPTAAPTSDPNRATAIPQQPVTDTALTPESSTAIPVIPIVPPTAQAEPPQTEVPPAQTFDYGIEAVFTGGSEAITARQIANMGMHWAKAEAAWRDIEPERGVLDFSALDAAVDALENAGLNILLLVHTAPDWARTSTVENGPPDSFADFNTFVNLLAARYAGRVQAYEIWNEPNLRREWNSPLHPIDAASYGDLLRGAYGSVKAADTSAVVVSAGLAPTGFDDGINAVDDRKYLTQLYAYGLASISDAVGAHPFGFGNPPESTCCAAPPGVETHYGHPSFYFMDTLNDYHKIMLDFDDADTLIWVTRFGWGTSEDMSEPPLNSRFVAYNSLQAQASNITHAFELAARSHYVGTMIVYNLNSCVAAPGNTEACYYSLYNADGQSRPAYNALTLMFGTAVQR